MALAKVAVGTLTIADRQNAVNNETVTIGSTVYTWKDTLAHATPNQVKVGATGIISIRNLADAVLEIRPNLTNPTTYSNATNIHPDVTAWPTGLTLFVHANVGGTAGNSIATTETMTQGAWSNPTLLGGTNAT